MKNRENTEGPPKIRGWVAREPDGSLRLFAEKPFFARDFNKWATVVFGEREFEDNTDSPIFSELTWESEPVEVELLIKKI